MLRHSNNTSPICPRFHGAVRDFAEEMKIKTPGECYRGVVVYIWLGDRVLAALFADASGSVAGLLALGLVLKQIFVQEIQTHPRIG